MILGPGLSVLVTIDRVGSQVAAAVQLINMYRLATVLIYIHCNGTVNGTARVVTAKHLLERTVCNVYRNVAVDIGITGTAVNSVHVLDAVQLKVDITVYFGVLAASVSLVNLGLANRCILIYRQGCSTYVTLTVTTAIYIVNPTANNVGTCNTGSVLVR